MLVNMGHTIFPWLLIIFFYGEEYLRPLNLSGFRMSGFTWIVKIKEMKFFPLNFIPFDGTRFADELVVL